jgi:hypothetical protein
MVAACVMCAVTTIDAADKPLKAFARDWEGRRIVLKRSLYSLVFDEVGRLGGTRRGKVTGLTVATPSLDVFYRFEGRQSQDDIVDRDPNRLVDLVRAQYQRAMHLEIGTVSSVAPLTLMQYPKGVELMVRTAQVERDRVRLTLRGSDPGQDDLATSLTIQWPTPLSAAFTERILVESLILQFLEIASARSAAPPAR